MERQRHTVKILPPDADAAAAFEDLAAFIRDASPVPVRVEHIGSTAIGIAGKGILDALVVTPSGDAARVQRAIAAAGLDQHSNSHPDDDRWYSSGTFVRPNGKRMHVHAHISHENSACEHEHLAFRDRLRADPREAARYVRLKHEWKAQAGDDRTAFTDLKTPYVRSVIARALGADYAEE